MAKEKAPPSGRSREGLVAQLAEVAAFMEILGENDFKVRAFRKGADAIEASKESLEDIASAAVKVPGVGEGLRAAVGEYVAHGEVAARAELAPRVPAGVLELMKLPGLGPKKAFTIAKELGVSSLGELAYACRENRLVTLKGFGEAAQRSILKAIQEQSAHAGKLRLDEALSRLDLLAEQLRKPLGKDAVITPVGALGRHREVVDSVELHFSGSPENVVAAVKTLDWEGGLEEEVSKPFGNELVALTGKLRDGQAVTLWLSNLPASAQEMHWMCAGADTREAVEKSSARFESYENSWLEDEWLSAGRVPTGETYRQSRDGRVRGVFHCHTDFSDGSATLEEMVRGAEKRGYEYIGISDHSQSAFYAQGLKPERIREQRQLIDELQKKTSIRIFHGIESDILADGALDYDAAVLESLDFIVGSIHSRFKMDEREMTARIVRALRDPHITMWGHPTGRLLLARKGYDVAWSEVLDAASAGGAALEFNANPQRLDVDWRLGPELESRKIPVFINPDAHSVEGLDDTRFGEMMAEKAMLPRGQILNLKGVSEMEKYLWERKRRRS